MQQRPTSYFRDWRFDRRTGQIEGLGPLDPNQLPEEYWCLVRDPHGRCLELQEHRPDLKAPAVKVLAYESDQVGPILEALDYNSNGSLRLVHEYYYDSRGRMRERREFDSQGWSRGRVESTWNDRDQEVEEAVYDRTGCLQARHRYQYNDLGQLAEETIFAGNGQLVGVRRFLYDDLQRLNEKQWYTRAGKLKSRFIRSYDSDHNLLDTQLLRG